MARIDVHHHISPPYYVEAIGSTGVATLGLLGKPPEWSPALSLAAMDRHDVDVGILSVSAPGFWFGDPAQTRRLVRKTNELMAGMVQDWPTRFGMFLHLPLPDVDASLEELAYGLDVLKADGVALLTNYVGRYLSDPAFRPLLRELDRRGAVVFVHPTTATYGVVPDNLPPATLEFPFETTRAIVDLLASGVLNGHRNIRFIFTHAGGTIPFLADRVARLARREEFRANVPDGVAATLGRLFYDTALSATPRIFGSLRQLVEPDHILLGTDFPFADEATLREAVGGFEALGLGTDEQAMINAGNASRLFPRFSALSGA